MLEREQALEALGRENRTCGRGGGGPRARGQRALRGASQRRGKHTPPSSAAINEGYRRCTAMRSDLTGPRYRCRGPGVGSVRPSWPPSSRTSSPGSGRSAREARVGARAPGAGVERAVSSDRRYGRAAKIGDAHGASSSLSPANDGRGCTTRAHSLEVSIEGARSRLGASEEAGGRDQRRLEELEERLRGLRDALEETEAPLARGDGGSRREARPARVARIGDARGAAEVRDGRGTGTQHRRRAAAERGGGAERA